MFIKTNGFKKLLKEAYKGHGLHIGATDNTIYVAGSYWAIEVVRKEIPKEKLAAIIELVGALPESGSQYLVWKQGEQMEIAGTNDFYNPLWMVDNHFDSMIQTELTPVVFDISGVLIRVLQEYKSGMITTIGDIFAGMIDGTEIDAERGHTYIEGPYLETARNGNVYFYNNIMAICICPVKPKGNAEKLVRYLEKYIINNESEERNVRADVSKGNDEEETEEA